MKCVCGYEYEEKATHYGVDFQGRKIPRMEVIKGDEPFIKISQVSKFNQGSDVYSTNDTISLYGCPKCETVRMER